MCLTHLGLRHYRHRTSLFLKIFLHLELMTDTILKYNKLLGIKCSKAFPLLVMKIPLLKHFATVSAKEFPLLIIEFGDAYKAPPEETGKGPSSESFAKKKGRTVVITTEDMQKRRNDVKARSTLLLALPDKHQLRSSKYETTKELWEAILNTFGGNEATKKIKKNQLKQQYSNFKAEVSEILEQTFNILQAIMSHLEFMDVEIEQDDLNQKFLTSLAPEWIMYTIVWRNRDELDTMSLDDVYNHLKVYESEVQKKSESNSQNMAFISSSNTSSGKGKVHTAYVPTASTQVSTASPDVATASLSHDIVCAYIASQSNGSQIRYEDITQIDEDDIEEMDIKWNMALLSMRADRFWKKTGKKITIQGSDVTGFDKLKVECFNCHKMGHFAKECRAPRIQDRGKRESYKQGPKEEEPAPKALMATDGIGWDWSYMANEEENHALVADDEIPTEFALMAKSGSSLENELGKDFLMPNKACFKCGHFDHLAFDCGVWVEKGKTWPKNNYAHKNVTPRAVLLKTRKTQISRPNMNVAQLKMTSFAKTAHSNVKRPFQGKSAVRAQPRVPRVSNVTKKFPTVDSKFLTAKSTFTVDLGNKEKAVKALACWIWRPKQNSTKEGPNCNGVSMTFKKYQYIDTQGRLNNFIMAKLAFCDYHNMIAILEKTKHNIEFHEIVDFLKASHIRYALTISPTIYVSHVRQFWSTARIETTNQETKILATVDGKPRTISESSLRRHLKLSDEEGISSLPDTEIFENLSLIGYNILPN
uniref:CCHC-type domain-containing protein n=1 Tax=Tanacetum cinerariifolium TaxID=118510 RepID=A0A6L2P5X1_TANCI|nr:hypothetical protein [Tanacetum cinerariifolium]